MAASGAGVTISAVDATHIVGSFDLSVQGKTLTGTFDIPICTPDASLGETAGWVTNRCCVQ